MADVTTFFFDIGGVILTNGWDRNSRREGAKKFNLDWEEFEDRHALVVDDFELGRLPLEEYLRRTVFYRARAFSQDEFKAFMYDQSKPNPEVLSIVQVLADSKKYLMTTLNNESLELNAFRIKKFNLREYFSVFLSSCSLGQKKPDSSIYKTALNVTQRAAEECLYIDERELNVECATRCGMRSICFENPEQLKSELLQNGIII
jgi:putative hydrolase of the HAD superfamily